MHGFCLVVLAACQPELQNAVVGLLFMLQVQDVLESSLNILRQVLLDPLMTVFLPLSSELQHVVQELRHLDVVDVHVNEFDRGYHSVAHEAKNVDQRLQVILSARGLHLNHVV